MLISPEDLGFNIYASKRGLANKLFTPGFLREDWCLRMYYHSL